MNVTNVYTTSSNLALSAPTIQANTLSFNNVTRELTWVRGNGSKVVIIAALNSSVRPPLDGVTYLQDTYYRGNLILYKGEDTSVILPLLPVGTYEIQAFEFNGAASVEKYLRSVGEDNPIEIVEGYGGTFDDSFDDTFG